MQDLRGKTAFVVGGSSGMGRAVARRLIECGADVVIAGRSRDKLAAAARSLGIDGATRTIPMDVTRPDDVAGAFSSRLLQRIDHLIVTAAEVTHGPFGEQPIDQARKMFESKFWGAYQLAKSALPNLGEGGSIVFISGVLSRRPGMNCAALGAACAALEALTRGLALELGPRIRVNCIAPGMVRTELHMRVPQDRRQIMFEKTGGSLPVGRIGEPAEIADAVLLAATNGYLTGHVLDVDGGHMVRQYAVP